MIGELIETGMDGARLNMSHGTREDHAVRARHVREAEAEAGHAIALIADLQGPKVRIGELSEPVDLARDDDIPVSPAVLGSVLTPGKDILINDGMVRLKVVTVERGRARCDVVVG